MKREEVLEHIVAVTENDPIVSTTGKASRELFETVKEMDRDMNVIFLRSVLWDIAARLHLVSL